MAKAKPKTEIEFQIHGLYNGVWEEVTAEVSFKAARDNLKDYRTNEPETQFRLLKKRVKIQG